MKNKKEQEIREKKRLDKIMPHNLEAEEALIGSVFINNEGLYKIIDIVSKEDFYNPANKEIFGAIISLFNERSPIDLVTITEHLDSKGIMDEVGGPAYLSRVVNSVPTASHIVQYANIVSEKKILRDLIIAANDISALAYQEDEDIDVTLDSAEKMLFGISQKTLRDNFVAVKNMLPETFERIDRLHKNKGELRGIPTGFDDLDMMLGGLQKSDLVILAARPSMGKTSFALNIALNAATDNNKKTVGIFSLEMSKDQLVDRLISSISHVDSYRLRSGDLREEDFPAIGQAMATLDEAPIFIDDSVGISVMEMRAKARRLKMEYGLDLIIIDYLQLMGGNMENRVQEISEISRALKGLARELDIPVVALSQLNRALEMRPDKKPLLSDLRESGSIEQDADVVMFVYRDEYYNHDTERKNIADIIVRKHRNGPTGEISLYFSAGQMRFMNLEKKHIQK